MSKTQKTLVWVLVLSPFLILFSLVQFTALELFGPLPSLEELDNPENNLATQVFSEDGVRLGEYYFENRKSCQYQELPPHLIEALIATEDIRFESHSGVDARSLFRAVYGVLTKKESGGASTISQQLAKLMFTEQPATGIDRVMQKIKEWVISAQLEKRYTKKEIILMYLNKFDWINNAVGIRSASHIYFSKEPKELSIAESAMLVGMLKNPSAYNPLSSNKKIKQAALIRRNVVLSQMFKYNFISKPEYDNLRKTTVAINYKSPFHPDGSATYFREFLRGYLRNWCANNFKSDGTQYNLYTDGLQVYTTINSKLQNYAEDAVTEHLSSLQTDFDNHWKGYKNAPFHNLDPKQINTIYKQTIKRSERYKKLKKRGFSEEEIMSFFKDSTYTMNLFAWKKDIKGTPFAGEITVENMTPLDSIKYNKSFIHSGMMSMDPHTGYVKAYVGGINYKHFQYDHVTQGKRQVGSTFKPFLYALAIQNGYLPCDEVLNVPVVFDKDEWGLSEDWIPQNSADDYENIPITLKFGLANSINTITAYIMKQIGPHAVVDLAKKIGVKSEILPVPSLCLGTFDLSVYEMVGAYSTFVNKGVWKEPIFITKIVDKNGVILEEFSPKTQEAMSEETADIIVRMLQKVKDGAYSESVKKKLGTAVRLNYKYGFKDREMGGKTGTTQNNSDGWFIGVTPDLVTGVWSGCEDRAAHFRSTALGQGANMALPVFAEYMQRVYADSTLTNNVSEKKKFNISEQTDLKLVCDENNIENNSEEEFE